MKPAALLLLLAACSVSLDPTTVSCRNDGECPSGTFCSNGKCGATAASCTSPAVKVGDACVTPPAMPTGLQAAVNSNVSLTWDAASDATSWVVVRDPGGQRFPVTAANYLDTGLTPGGTYAYSVIAKNAAGEGLACPAVNATTIPGAPTPTAGLDVARTGVTLTWPSVTGATAYEVHRASAAGQELLYQTVNDPGTGGTVSFNDPAPFSGLTGFYKVLARNAGGAGALSSEVSQQTAPAAPVTVTATSTGTSVDLAWSASTGATGFAVFRSGTQVGGTLPVSPRTYTDTPPAGTTNTYTVSAINSTGTGPASTGQQATLAPGSPTLGVASLSTNGSTTTVNLSWTRPAGATDYDVFRNGTPDTLIVSLTDPTSTYPVSEIPKGATITYHVVAKNAAPTGAASNNVSATTAPAAPLNLHTTAVGATSVTLAWGPSATAGSYRVTRSLGINQTVVGTVNDPTVTITDNGVSPSEVYQYTVRAIDAATGTLASASSTPADVITATPAATGLSAAPFDDTHIDLSWNGAAVGVDSYDVLRGTAPGGENSTPVGSRLNPGTGGQVSFTDSTASANTTYYYTVVSRHATTPVQAGAPSNEANARSLYPAPTNLVIKGTADDNVSLQWTGPAGGPYTFEVLRGLVADQYTSAESCAGTGSNPEGCIDGSLVQNATYHYRVRVHDLVNDNVSLPSNDVQAVTTNLASPDFVPQVLSTSSVQLSISRMPGYDIYDIFQSTSPTPPTGSTPPSASINSVSGNGDLLVIATRPVTPGTVNFWVRARWSGSGLSVTPWSAAPQSVTTNPALTAPGGLGVLGLGATLVNLVWTPVTGATSYSVSRSPGGPLGTTTSAFFTDTTVNPGTSYSYTVATNGGSLSSSTGTVTTVSNPATTFTCSQPNLINYYSDGPTQTKLGLPGLKVFPVGGSSINVNAFGDGRCLATGLPPSGSIWVRRGQNYFLIGGRSADMSSEVYGRIDSGSYQSTTPATFNITGLSSWAASDQIELFGSNNLTFFPSLQASVMSGLPAPGSSALNGFTVDIGSTFGSQIDTASADKPTLVDMVTLSSSKGIPYQVVAKKLDISSFSGVDGRPITVNGAFTDVLGSAVSKPFKFLRSQFKAMPTQIGPTGIQNDVADFISVIGVPKDGSAVPTPHGFVGGTADIAVLSFPAGTTADVDMGNIVVPSPYPASWFTAMDVAIGFNSPTSCGAGNAPLNVGLGAAIIDDAASMFTKAASGIAPALPPLTSPKISADGTSFVDVFQPRTAMGTSPSFQWTVPNSLPLPNYIRIFLYEIAADVTNQRCMFKANGVLTTGQVQIAQFFMPVSAAGTMTMPALPPNILLAGHTYVATIRSVYEPGRDVVGRPLMRGSAEYFTEVVTNTFAP